MRSFYYASQKMQSVIAYLKAHGLVTTLTNGDPRDSGLYQFLHLRDNVMTHVHSRDDTVDVLNCSDFNRMRAAISAVFQSTKATLQDVVGFVEEQAHHTTEWLDLHAAIIQLAIAHASTMTNSQQPLVLHGNFARIGYLEGNVIVRGNVEVIEGRISNFLTIHGNVVSLGVGPFWAQSPVEGQNECKLTIYGDVDGYKTGINNPLLTINIYGRVTNPHAFLYRGCVFKSMTIYGRLETKTSILPGFFSGKLFVNGDAPHLQEYLKTGYRGSSASIDGHGNVWLNNVPLLADGRLIQG
ncbi:MAG TPA: hypothetical protein VFB03_03505 [Candidatus Saccharimonadales bacterium]|nr:hypothetical protein [Candidatus Saccharimonadales bacterium]